MTEARFSSALSTRHDSTLAVREAVEELREGLGGRSPDLLVAFASQQHAAEFETLAARLGSLAGARVLVGCGAESVIGRGQEVERMPALSLWGVACEDLELEPFKGGAHPVEGWEAEMEGGQHISYTGHPDLAGQEKGAGSLLLFGDPYSFPMAAYLEKLGTYTNTDRRVQVGRPAIEMPGEARLDWEIVCDISTRMGYPMSYDGPEEVFREFASVTESYRHFTYDNLGPTGKLWPNETPETDDGPIVLFGDGFPTANGRAKFVPADWEAAAELPDDEYPFVLSTGRLLEHWHTGSMTRRSRALDAISPQAYAGLHVSDAKRLGVNEGDWVKVSSRRGSVTIMAKIADKEIPGGVFIPFHFREAAANLLTLDELDPAGKIPGFKFCAVKVEKA